MSEQTGMQDKDLPPQTRHFYVDEAGDMTLFDKKGRVLIGTGLVSRFFMVGVADIPDPAQAQREISVLRNRLCSDP